MQILFRSVYMPEGSQWKKDGIPIDSGLTTLCIGFITIVWAMNGYASILIFANYITGILHDHGELLKDNINGSRILDGHMMER